jgi:plastocyanin
MLWRATVQREDPAKPIGFSPQETQAQAGDALFWYNEDPDTPHQPVPDSGKWNIPEIPGHNSSDQLRLASAGTFGYHCALHSDEQGSIVVANAVLIAQGSNPLFGATKIPKGQCVSWGNSTGDEHQPCPDEGKPWFDAPIASGDLSKYISFADAGTFAYHCAVHPDNKEETGSITVT